jgi:CheY-like chemotaxis protein
MNACGCNDKIVIVDDEPYNLLVLESMLKKLGY